MNRILTVLIFSLAFGILAISTPIDGFAKTKRSSSTSPKGKATRYKTVEKSEDQSQDELGTSSSSESGVKPIPQNSNVFLGFGFKYFDSFGFSGRYAYRLFPHGFIPDFKDSFFLELGTGVTFYGNVKGSNNVTGVELIGAGRWDFFVIPDWAFFGLVGFGYNIINGVKNEDVTKGGFFPAIGVGAIYDFSSEWAVRADIGYPLVGAGVVYRF